jgi:hypothetical protein
MSARCVGTPELSAGPPDIYSKKRTARVDRSAYRPSKTRWRKEQSSWAGGYEQDFLPNGWQTRFGNVATDFFAEFDGQRDKRVIVKVMVKILTASWL